MGLQLEPVGIVQIVADRTYDCAPIYQAIVQCGGDLDLVIRRRKTAFLGVQLCSASKRDYYLNKITTERSLAWQEDTGFEQRARILCFHRCCCANQHTH